MELPGQKAVPFLVFWGNSILFSTVAAPVCIPTNSVLGFPFLHNLTSTCLLIYDGHSDWCEVVPHCVFNLHFSEDLWCWASFYMSLGPLHVLLGEVYVQVCCPFFNWVVCLPGVESCEFFIFWRSNPCLRCHWQICFPMWLTPFPFCLCFLWPCTSFLVWCSHICLFFPLYPLPLRVYQWKCCRVGYLKFYCLFSSRTFMVSQLIVKSFIHLEFIWAYGVSWWSSFIFLHVLVWISQHHLLKRLFLLHFMFPFLCQISTDCIDMGLFLDFLFCFIGLCVCSYASTRLF